MRKWFEHIPFSIVLIGAVLLGLAPFYPQPHLVEKIQLLVQGRLVRPIDIFDLLYHAFPFVLLFAKIYFFATRNTPPTP